VLAKFFRETYLDRILRHNLSLFFESGSTVAYVAKELAPALSGHVRLGPTGELTLQVSTNNVLAYLEFWLAARVPCAKFPWSPPTEETYGASYGGLERIQEQQPYYDGRPLDTSAQEEIGRLRKLKYGFADMRRPTLLLAAASGLQLEPSHNVSFPEDFSASTKARVIEEIDKRYGPHVGSYHNKVFKRFMYDSGLPVMIFITGDKVDCEIAAGKCHFILDEELTWEQFCTRHPVAFCIGTHQSAVAALQAEFERLGFELLARPTTHDVTALIARNFAFVDEFDRAVPMGSKDEQR
jgi:hypothetical protein